MRDDCLGAATSTRSAAILRPTASTTGRRPRVRPPSVSPCRPRVARTSTTPHTAAAPRPAEGRGSPASSATPCARRHLPDPARHRRRRIVRGTDGVLPAGHHRTDRRVGAGNRPPRTMRRRRWRAGSVDGGRSRVSPTTRHDPRPLAGRAQQLVSALSRGGRPRGRRGKTDGAPYSRSRPRSLMPLLEDGRSRRLSTARASSRILSASAATGSVATRRRTAATRAGPSSLGRARPLRRNHHQPNPAIIVENRKIGLTPTPTPQRPSGSGKAAIGEHNGPGVLPESPRPARAGSLPEMRRRQNATHARRTPPIARRHDPAPRRRPPRRPADVGADRGAHISPRDRVWHALEMLDSAATCPTATLRGWRRTAGPGTAPSTPRAAAVAAAVARRTVPSGTGPASAGGLPARAHAREADERSGP